MHQIKPRHHTFEREKTNETGTFSYCAYVVIERRDLRSGTHQVRDVSFVHGYPYDDDAGRRRHCYQLVKQNVYDSSNNKIGEIVDVLVNKGGEVTAVMISVGGFLGMDAKDVAAPFRAIHATMKDNKWWLVMNTTKDALKAAPGYKYDKNSTTWVSEKS